MSVVVWLWLWFVVVGRVNDAGGSDKTWATRILFSDLAGLESELRGRSLTDDRICEEGPSVWLCSVVACKIT